MGRVPTISLVRPTPCRARKLSEFLLCIIGLPSLLRPLALQASQRLHRRARLTPLETEVTCALNSDRLQSEPSIKKTTIKKTWQESRVLDVRKLGVLRPRAQENRPKSTQNRKILRLRRGRSGRGAGRLRSPRTPILVPAAASPAAAPPTAAPPAAAPPSPA